QDSAVRGRLGRLGFVQVQEGQTLERSPPGQRALQGIGNEEVFSSSASNGGEPYRRPDARRIQTRGSLDPYPANPATQAAVRQAPGRAGEAEASVTAFRSITGPTATDRRRWFGLDRCNGRRIRPDRGAPRPDVLAPRPARSSTTQHDLTPPLRRYGRSGARAPSIYLGREPNAATSIPNGAADVKFNIPRGGPHRGGGRIGPGVDTKRGGLWRRAVAPEGSTKRPSTVGTVLGFAPRDF
ncbi:hypothetical protein THAOC_29553, partial [Thalassiosira oceanica]